jgi:7-cyano-7-deazaguanine synthase in queuosine biosynthesis
MHMALEQQTRCMRSVGNWLTKLVFDLAGQGYGQLTVKDVPVQVRYTFDIPTEWAKMRDGLATAFKAAVAESLEEIQWCYADNREDFMRCRRGRVEDDKVVATNYEAEEAVVIRFLATVTPYQLWRMREDVREAAAYALNDYLDDGGLVGNDSDDDCKDCAVCAQEAFEEAVTAIEARMTAEAAVEAAERAVQAAKPNYNASPIWAASV